MKPKSLALFLFVLPALGAFCPLAGAEPPRMLYWGNVRRHLQALQNPKPLQTEPVYVKRDTWHDSMCASLEATFAADVAKANSPEGRQTRDVLWDLVARDFRDRQSQIEMEMERRDGLWNEYAPAWAGAQDAYYLAHARERLALARKTLELVERTGPRPKMAAELEAMEQQLAGPGETSAPLSGRALFAKSVDLRRRILFSHPALDFDRLLLTKRPPPLLSAPGDNYYGLHSGTGPGLVVLEGWKSDRPEETVLLEDKLPPGCVIHQDVSFDGRRIVFAYADHTPPRERWQFFLYEIGVDGTGLRQITGTASDPMTGAGGRNTVLIEDYDPAYLPDGGIAFISTRNQGGVRCHDGDRYCPTYLLYRCDADGSNIRQLSFGEANEWDPKVMPDGRVLWMRWDYINRPVIPTLGLWTIRPDGTAAEHFFGNYTENPQRICEVRPIPGSHKLVAQTSAEVHQRKVNGTQLLKKRSMLARSSSQHAVLVLSYKRPQGTGTPVPSRLRRPRPFTARLTGPRPTKADFRNRAARGSG